MTRIENLKKEIKRAGLDAYFTMSVKNIYYLTDFMDISAATLNLIIPLDGTPMLLTQPLSYVAATEKARDCIIKEIGFERTFLGGTISELKNLKLKKIGFDELSISMYLELIKNLESMEFVYSPDTLTTLRWILFPFSRCF